jgi:hypothetical protein
MLKTEITTWVANISIQSAFKSGERSVFIQKYQPSLQDVGAFRAR